MNLSTRSAIPEIMDTQKVDIKLLENVFLDINKANDLLGGAVITINAVNSLVQEYPKKEYTIIDMGCGDGTMLRKLALISRKHQAKFSFIGIDLNQMAIDLAREKSKDFTEIQFVCQDILMLKPDQFTCDILLCTLTMHHFENQEIKTFMAHFIQLSQIGVIVNDLQRSALACYLFRLFSGIFIKTKIAKHDGLVSIKRGFKKKDLINLSKSFPKSEHIISWKWAFRYVWIVKQAN
ncbi:methyltransferase domain-containing protein [Eudoraea chungangensis]|uniref:methyltransferase domain-containing protein n=1 Tax=Eudoraea chungangensis TaxID=1481905 RepID=UPI0023EA9B49|nr:methyltransferase domain-containing protein [Eudoraea chungangensis]